MSHCLLFLKSLWLRKLELLTFPGDYFYPGFIVLFFFLQDRKHTTKYILIMFKWTLPSVYTILSAKEH